MLLKPLMLSAEKDLPRWCGWYPVADSLQHVFKCCHICEVGSSCLLVVPDWSRGAPGGILSTTHYKLFNNGLLHEIDESGLGASIGCFRCGAPTCADDVAVLGNKVYHARCMVEIVRGYCCR